MALTTSAEVKFLLWFARSIHLADDDFIRIFEGAAEFGEERLCARVSVRLPDGPNAAFRVAGARSQPGLPQSRWGGGHNRQ